MNPPAPPLRLQDCWAKTDPATSLPALSVRDHCLNVGAVAEAIWNRLPDAVRSRLPSSAVLLAAMHDIGKLTVGFLQQCPAWKARWAGEGADAVHAAGAEKRHALVSQKDLEFRADALRNKALKRWAAALGGHHGQFTEPPPVFHEHRKAEFGGLRDELLAALITVFGPLQAEMIRKEGPEHTARISLLTGFIIAADWIGSNNDWFPLPVTMLESPLESAAAEARRMAANALTQAQWQMLSWKAPRTFGELFAITYPPSDLQCTACEHITAPGLYIMEAPMGTGKTEAALWPAFEMIRSGVAGGLYFALPTQLTSNSIHQRLGEFAARAGGDAVRVPLVHSASWLKSAESLVFSSGGDADEREHWRQARSWFTQRRALLAPLGAGTIDQSLMGTLPVKYAALRLFGLAGKIIIFDEVHSYDVYTGTVLDCLVRLLRELGCTVIILSATLTRARRRDLLGLPAGAVPSGDEAAYPALTCAPDGAAPEIIPVARDPRMARAVTLEHVTVTTPELTPELRERIAALAAAGACVLIVRNTVKLAQETWAALKPAVCEGIEVGLIHSRFPHFLRHGDDTAGLPGREAEWVQKLGRNRERRPQGCILVGTQVLEQSLDIDADFLITDHCPIDLFLQRLGRLHRHEAPENHPRPDICREPRAIILHPALPDRDEPDPQTWKKALRPHGSIYTPIVLLRSQAVLREHDELLHLPVDIRPLIEHVYDASPCNEPAAWAALETELTDKKRELRSLALAFAKDPITRHAGSDDEHTAATRIIDCPTVPLVLLTVAPAVQPGGAVLLKFLHGPDQLWNPHEEWNHSLARAIFLNAVPVPFWWLKSAAFSAPDWLARHVHGAACAAVKEAGGNLRVLTETELPAVLHFAADAGVSAITLPRATIQHKPFEDEDETFWN